MSEAIVTLRASPLRRFVGVTMLAVLSALLLWIALDRPPPAPVWRVFLVVLGIAAGWFARAVWRATRLPLQLTSTALTDGEGRVLARLDEIERVDRGLFALKPPNGFTLRLRTAGTRVWAPGLWWRVGRRVGIGGVTRAGEARAVAQLIETMLAERRYAEQELL